MSIEYAFVLSGQDQVGSGALIGQLIHKTTSLYHSFMVFDGARQLFDADMMGLVRGSTEFDDPACVVIAVLSAFKETPFESEPAEIGRSEPSADVSLLLGYFLGRLPKSHVFVIRDEATSDFWIDPEITEISPLDRNWRTELLEGLSGVGVDADLSQIADD